MENFDESYIQDSNEIFYSDTDNSELIWEDSFTTDLINVCPTVQINDTDIYYSEYTINTYSESEISSQLCEDNQLVNKAIQTDLHFPIDIKFTFNLDYSIPKLFDLNEYNYFYDWTIFIQTVFEPDQKLIKN